MSPLPKLRIKIPFGDPNEAICYLEQARYRFHYGHAGDEGGVLVTVEVQVINSDEELVQLANREEYKDREFLNVELLPAISAGG